MSMTTVELNKALGEASADLRRDAEAGKVDIGVILDIVDVLTETVQDLHNQRESLTDAITETVH